MDILTELSVYGEDVYFNPDFLEVDRILDTRIVQEDLSKEIICEGDDELDTLLVEEEYGRSGTLVKEFLVKWKSLPYGEVSWEVYSDFQNSEAIRAYYHHEYVL